MHPFAALLSNKNIIWIFVAYLAFISLVALYFVGRSAGKNKAKIFKLNEIDKSINFKELSYTTQFYKNLADSLFNAYAGGGTNETLVYSVFYKINNLSDFYMLAKQFGIRKSAGWEGNFMQWLLDELQNFELDNLRKILLYKNIVAPF